MKKKQVLVVFIGVGLILVLIALGINMLLNYKPNKNSLKSKEVNTEIKDYKYEDFTLSDIKIEKSKKKTIVIGTVLNNSDNLYNKLYLKVSVITNKKIYDSYIELNNLEAQGGLGIRIEYMGDIKNINSVTIENSSQEAYDKFLNSNE